MHKLQHIAVWLHLLCVQHEAAKVQEGIAALLTEKTQLAARVEAQAQLLASPDLLQNHPELRWEHAAAGSGPSLGTAKELFVRDRKLTDFRWVLVSGLLVTPCMQLAHTKSIAEV